MEPLKKFCPHHLVSGQRESGQRKRGQRGGVRGGGVRGERSEGAGSGERGLRGRDLNKLVAFSSSVFPSTGKHNV